MVQTSICKFTGGPIYKYKRSSDSHIGFICMCKVNVSKINDILQRFGELPQMLYIVYSQRLGGYLCLCILWPCEHKHRLMLAKT